MSEATPALDLINVSDRALREIREIFDREHPDNETGLRLGVVGGGCSGLSYQMDFSELRPGDHILDIGAVRVLFDPKSAIYLKGVTLDFEDGFSGKGFVFRNPNATNTCGCGESFGI